MRHNARRPKETGVHLPEQMSVDETNREFGRHGGHLEEDLVEPKKLGKQNLSFGIALHTVGFLLSVALVKSGYAVRDLDGDDHSPIE